MSQCWLTCTAVAVADSVLSRIRQRRHDRRRLRGVAGIIAERRRCQTAFSEVVFIQVHHSSIALNWASA